MELAAGLVIVAALNLYAVSGGADFGGGFWDLLARGPRAQRQRELIAHAIGPIWEANHVWLILAIVVLFTAFPPAFARVTTVLHIPLFLMLLGIIARGAAFSFRAYGDPARETQRPWGPVFAVSSLLTPLLLGVVLGAIASGTGRPWRPASSRPGGGCSPSRWGSSRWRCSRSWRRSTWRWRRRRGRCGRTSAGGP